MLHFDCYFSPFGYIPQFPQVEFSDLLYKAPGGNQVDGLPPASSDITCVVFLFLLCRQIRNAMQNRKYKKSPGSALRVSRAVTRLTVYRPLQVILRRVWACGEPPLYRQISNNDMVNFEMRKLQEIVFKNEKKVSIL